MELKIFSKRLRHLRELLNTHDGKQLLKYLHEDYVRPKVMCNDPNLVFYELGKKELVEDLFEISRISTDELDQIHIVEDSEAM